MSQELPMSIEAEMSTLGSILLDELAIYKISTILTKDDFYSLKHQIVYEAVMDLFKSGIKIDLLTISEYLDNKKQIDQIGGRTYLASLYNATVTASNAFKYAQIVKDKAVRRNLLRAQELNLQTIYDESRDIDSVLAETHNRLIRVNNIKNQDDSAQSIIKELDSVQEQYAEKYAKGDKFLGFSCGLEKIDNIIDGMRPGHIWVVGAWTSTGKTQFALNIVNAVLEQKIPVSIVSLEMSRVDLAARMIGIRQNMSSMKVLRGKLDEETWKNIEKDKQFLYDSPLEIHTTYFDLEKIKMIIRKDVFLRGVKLVVLDYVQNIISERGKKEYDLLTQAAIDLQALAREIGVTIYLVSQISNESEKGGGAGAGFKGTGALEAVADLAIRLKRDKNKENPDDSAVKMQILITKNRHGFTGNIEDYFMYLKSGLFHQNPSMKVL